MTAATEIIHATSVAIGGRGVLITGPSGSGKSDLAVRLIDRGAVLISDDYTVVVADGDRLRLRPPANIAGKMEIRHLGIVDMPYIEDVPAVLLIRLEEQPERMPDPFPSIILAGITLPLIALAGREPSAPIKAEWALRLLARTGDA